MKDSLQEMSIEYHAINTDFSELLKLQKILEKSFQKTGMLICVLISMKSFSHLLRNANQSVSLPLFFGISGRKTKGRTNEKNLKGISKPPAVFSYMCAHPLLFHSEFSAVYSSVTLQLTN